MQKKETESIRQDASPELDTGELLARVALLEEEARTLREQLEVVNEYGSDGYWDWLVQDEYEYMSPRFWEIFGYQPAEKRHHPSEWQALIHPDDLPGVFECFEKHVETRGRVPFDQQVRYLHKQGHWVTVRCRGRVIEWGESGEPLRMIGTHTDLTDILEERSRAEILYSSSTVGIWDWVDVDGQKEHWTPQFYRLLGYEPGEIPATLGTFTELLHPEDRERTFALVQHHFDGVAAFDIEYRLRTRSGEYRWFHGTGEVVRDADGRPTRMVGAIQDIHARRKAEEQLTNLSVRHQLSMQASNIGIWDWDVVRNDLVWDQQMYGLYGIEEKDFGSAYEAWLAGVHPEDKERGDTEIQAALADPMTPFDTQFRVLYPSGEVRQIRAIATTIRDDQGQPLRMVGVNWDITEETRTKEQLERANDDLTQFAYRTSHDLKAPLASIEGLTRIAAEDLDDGDYEEVQVNIDRVGSQARRLITLVNDILSLTRSELGDVEFEQVSMEALLAGSLKEVEAVFPGSPVQARFEVEGPFDEPIPGVRLRQIISNLASNSFKYCDPAKDSPALCVRALDAGASLRIQIEDNGLGIPAENQRDVFEMFKRFHPEVSSGSGLGMSIVKRHVDRLHGRIDFESTAAGTTFNIVIPYRTR